MARFEAHYREGESGDRLPEWIVVEFGPYVDRDGTRIGDVVWKTTDMEFGKQDASDMAYWMQQVYNWEFAQ